VRARARQGKRRVLAQHRIHAGLGRIQRGFEAPQPVSPGAALHLRFPAIALTPVPPHETDEEDEDPNAGVEPIPYSQAKKDHDEKLRILIKFFDDARAYQRVMELRENPEPPRPRPPGGGDGTIVIFDLAAYIGGGGLGDFITAGIAMMALPQLLVGAIPATLLSLSTDAFFGWIQRALTPSGLRAP